MNISEQVKELRNIAKHWEYDAPKKPIPQIFNEAADTIESLSAKLQAENCGGGWIYCGDGKNMPEEHDSIFKNFKGTEKWKDAMFETTSNEVEVTVEFEDGTRKTMTAHTLDGKWKVDTFVKNNVIAWRPFPAPYHEP